MPSKQIILIPPLGRENVPIQVGEAEKLMNMFMPSGVPKTPDSYSKTCRKIEAALSRVLRDCPDPDDFEFLRPYYKDSDMKRILKRVKNGERLDELVSRPYLVRAKEYIGRCVEVFPARYGYYYEREK